MLLENSNVMTELLYLHDAYLREFAATVVALDSEANALAVDRRHSSRPVAGSPTTLASSPSPGLG